MQTNTHPDPKDNLHPILDPILHPKDNDELLGKLGKKLVKKYGLSSDLAEKIELDAADVYAHPTREGWCCACDADIAFATKYIQDEPEFEHLISTQVVRAQLAQTQRCERQTRLLTNDVRKDWFKQELTRLKSQRKEQP